MVTARTVRNTVDQLAAEQGERQGKIYHLEKTTGELIEVFGLKPSAPHHRHIKGIIEMHYPGTTAEALGSGDGSSGFKLHIKIRSR